ncbi:MAG: TMEM175 family protein [Candidatus Levyibacteriota bacterium]
MSKDRVEAFSDGVFAVVLTLLILGLDVPNVANHASLTQYAAAMTPLLPKVASFALTFVIIAIHWVSHHYFFGHLKRAPLGLVWLNNLFLLWLCFMPFPTALLGDHPTDQFPILLFGVNQLLAALTFFGFRNYASKNKLFVNSAIAKSMGPRHSIPAITLYSLTILFAFVNVSLSLACLFLVPLLYFVPNMVRLD